MLYDVIIGLEIHVQLNTKSKMFCRCANLNEDLDKEPNTTVCPICLGHPGTLPVANKQATEWTILTGLALNCKINGYSKFDRKHYFYPDLPKAYQISQYDLPLCYDGELEIDGRQISITRIHLEEDTGKLTHPAGKDYSLADFNRAGAPLMELVTEPVIKTAAEAKKFCQSYQQILRYLEISEADMEKGQMRCEVNLSLQEQGKWKYEGGCKIKPIGNYILNPKVEVKNIGSFRSVERAIEYEIKRQTETLAKGGKLVQETRGWNDNRGTTVSQRSKEEAHDYRYFPDPDVSPMAIGADWLKKIQTNLPELPQAKKIRFRQEYGFSDYDAEILTGDKAVADYTEKVISELRAWVETNGHNWETIHIKLAKLTGNWVGTELFKYFNETKTDVKNLKITPENFGEFIALIYDNKINSSAAQIIFKKMFERGGDPSDIMEEKGLAQMEDENELEKIAKKIINNNEKAAKEYKAGKENAIQFLVGQMMKESKGKANPQKAREILLKNLK
ncbi:Asp-tRNA(Asn)/Glu-tRNA(Gln) amidotransferase subunit GatB [Candidatus Falkowbacteria bacterium CG10_big_fil_rev_8_21_14_0_10_43_11]|uniref:Aspartyl/glutamyl-tRNA(Asn/Gln) amidotransferase subunit B n=1 Tax=Candidatus Falkowbacteria bacterium CG10_big_fil_rev_8_21_14_0_10_43_11 TaxID=1974568 RepID=A0A2M6WN41_9BACT|nr:MAG: Asp-tRNA(Asn)/Glu-tRNA(Gln) amidotransferase subunit GatB [Candidatus Falkowbacteria bacterium CG10_big_fil_rev_8_21_14_0_10_43_11]